MEPTPAAAATPETAPAEKANVEAKAKASANANTSEGTAAGIKERIGALLQALGQGLYEREEPLKLALLTAIAGESIFLLGPPGVGKSLVARRLKHAFSGGSSFEYLMSRFSTPDEVFGPISIQKLKNEDKYERKVENYMPTAHVVFLDEIWKASPAIQNALLTIINEKLYRNGETTIKVNIKGLIAASNELPPEGESFDPLWDRFLLRYSMEGIKQHNNFLRMITATDNVYEVQVPPGLAIAPHELEAWSPLINQVAVPQEVLNTIQVIRLKIEEHNQKHGGAQALVQAYDRRWKKMVRLMRTAAFLNGRQAVDLMDCFLIFHCLWNAPGQMEQVREIVTESIRKHGYSVTIKLSMVKNEVAGFEEEVAAETKIKHSVTKQQLKPWDDEYYEILKDNTLFEGSYVKISGFEKLRQNEFVVTNIYDGNKALLNRLQAKKGEQEFTIEVQHNSAVHVFHLKTMKRQQEEVISKAPHRLVKAYWDERHASLLAYVQEQQQRLEAEYPSPLNEVVGHLFIDARLAPVVKANHQEVVQALSQLKLRLEKLKFSYDKLG